MRRAVALGRCLGSVLSLARSEEETILDIGHQGLRSAPPSTIRSCLAGVRIDCHVFVSGEECLSDVLECFAGRIQVHHEVLENPRLLPAAARDYLLKVEEPADLSLYLEDDLVIHDRLFVDKLIWFSERTQHKVVLMPHRYECSRDPEHARLYVDGPLRDDFIGRYYRPMTQVAEGRFWDGQEVTFDAPGNPHSGLFALTAPQRQHLRGRPQPIDGFVGPLESVATYTALSVFPVWKPAWHCRDFLAIEHAFPSFLGYLGRLPQLLG
ncbi:hypothetical protein [Synechococcus sp. RedBA-s]|uniref:hypothetical protein n=1 Tax=Synechococcus sp. RedBA-s TaxID=2823741 RepID=UPI0020CEA793|nr:hypothetical protein [Synechococcus sp. RedBA-s]MCP9799186.1 hypothetical protein [Synechococcus sp. RedBA-s]